MPSVKRGLQRWRDRYLDKHLPAMSRVDLKQHQLFVFPTAFGGVWLALVALCYLLGTNYQNNLVLLLAYWLLSIWIICIVRAFRNMHRLQLQGHAIVEGPLDDHHAWSIEMSRPVVAMFARVDTQAQVRVQDRQLQLQLPARHRGVFQLPRVKIWSDYPLGLIRCWSYPQLTGQQFVYPSPQLIAGFSQGAAEVTDSNDTVDGLRDYRAGDPLQRVDWGRFARQQRLTVKVFAADSQSDIQLLEATACTESLASHFAALVLQAQQTHQFVELKLPHVHLPADNSSTHYRQILRALASW